MLGAMAGCGETASGTALFGKHLVLGLGVMVVVCCFSEFCNNVLAVMVGTVNSSPSD